LVSNNDSGGLKAAGQIGRNTPSKMDPETNHISIVNATTHSIMQNNDYYGDTEGFRTPLGSPTGVATIVDAAGNDDLEMLEEGMIIFSYWIKAVGRGETINMDDVVEELNEEGFGDSNNEQAGNNQHG
jgi:hypothetical protein